MVVRYDRVVIECSGRVAQELQWAKCFGPWVGSAADDDAVVVLLMMMLW